MVDQHVLLEWSQTLGRKLFINMITSQHIDQLDEKVEGDFLFVVKTTLVPVKRVIDKIISGSCKSRTSHFICSDNSNQYGKLMDLSNSLKNNGHKSFLYKGKFSDYLKESSFSSLALVYLEPCEFDVGNTVLENIHKSLNKSSLIVYNNVDYSSISDYISNRGLTIPRIDSDNFFRWSNIKAKVEFNNVVKRSKSNNF